MKDGLKQEFSAASAKPEEPGNLAFLDRLLALRPDLNGQTAYFPSQGQCAHTVLIGEEAFKTSRTAAMPDPMVRRMQEFLDREYAVMKHLEGKGLPAPRVTWTGPVAPDGTVSAFGMTRERGVQLDRGIVDAMTPAEKRQLAKDLAGFMVGFSAAVADADLKKLGFEGDALTAWEVKPEELKTVLENPKIVEALAGDLDFCRRVQDEFGRRHEAEYRGRPMETAHRDMKPGNLLYDPEARRLSAVIDFGGSGFTRPEHSLAQLLWSYGAEFAGLACEEYSAASGKKVTLRDVRNWDAACAISNLVFCTRNPAPSLLKKMLERVSKAKADFEPVAPASPRRGFAP